ncbi:MAG: hypothetical protein JW709_09450 [Sedimentisphaerales bacterium]|nr:hypothetical protein [Sedimentisphaerales bacterium]
MSEKEPTPMPPANEQPGEPNAPVAHPDHDDHAHDHHGHHHAREEAPYIPEDPGNAALADALRISFKVLKLVMIVVVIVFIASGVYQVPSNEVAVVLRFGRVTGTGANRIKEPGLHWSFPRPIDERIMIPRGKQQLDVDDFWYFMTKEERAGLKQSFAGPTLQFLQDGYSLTSTRGLEGKTTSSEKGVIADYSIMHSQWRIEYAVSEPPVFIEKLWDGTEAGWSDVERLIRDVLAAAVIKASGHRDVWATITREEEAFRWEVESLVKDRMIDLNVGLTIDQVIFTGKKIIPPRQVQAEYERFTTAKTNAEKMKTSAGAKASEIRNTAESEAKVMVATAEAYRKSIVEAARSDAQRLEDMLAKVRLAAEQRVPGEGAQVEAQRRQVYNDLLAVTVDELYQEMLRDVLAAADEVFVPASGETGKTEWRLQLSRDATLGKKKQDEQKK